MQLLTLPLQGQLYNKLFFFFFYAYLLDHFTVLFSFIIRIQPSPYQLVTYVYCMTVGRWLPNAVSGERTVATSTDVPELPPCDFKPRPYKVYWCFNSVTSKL